MTEEDKIIIAALEQAMNKKNTSFESEEEVELTPEEKIALQRKICMELLKPVVYNLKSATNSFG